VVVPNLSNLQHLVPPPAVGAASGAASTAVVVASVEADVVLAAGEEEDSETEEDLETEAAVDSEEEVVASGEAGMTLDHREVEVATGSCSDERCGTCLTFTLEVEVVAWATKAGDSMTARLLGGTEVLLDLVVGPVDQVGMVLPAEGQVSVVPPVAVAVVLVGIVETEDTSNERAQEVTTTGTQNGHDTRFFAIAPQQGMCKCVV
jgi:hypothetical protein